VAEAVRWKLTGVPRRVLESDEVLADRIRRGDAAAFDLFFERYAARLVAYLEGMVGERAAAEDLLQETMLRVFRHIHRYEERGRFRAWVFRTATNAALSELRRRRYAAGAALEGAALEVAEARAGDPAENHAKERRRRATLAALARLGEDQRSVVLLRMREELSVREIAATLGIPEGTVKSRMHHAIRRMRDWIEGAAEAASRMEPEHEVR
jgi:RNA polymerase sigma-70 factor (ECF subfamily)